MRKLIMLLGFVLLMSETMAQYDPEALAVLDAMSAKYKKIEAFNATFTQKLTNKQANLDETLTGKVAVKGKKFVLDVAGVKVYNDGSDMYTYNEEIKEVTISPYIEEESEITLGNVYELYKEGFKYALISELPNGDRVIEMDPESRDKSYFKIKMVIKSTDDLRSFTVFERSGNTYIYSIDSFEPTALSDNFFVFDTKKYPDVEVIDFR